MVKRSGSARGDRGDQDALDDESVSLWGEELNEVPREILVSAVRCFAANGFHATTTRDIATRIGLSPAALYVHFSSKEHVLFEIVLAGHRNALAAVEEAAGTSPASTERLHALVSAFVVWHARHHVAGRVCQYEMHALAAEHYEEIREIRRRFNAVFGDAVAAGIGDGSFAPVDEGGVVRALLSLGIDLVRWYRHDGPDSPEQLGEFYARLALNMVAAPTGELQRTRGSK